MPPLVRSGDAGTAAQQGARAIAIDLLGKMSAPLDQPSLPFDDTWIQEIKVCVLRPVLRLFCVFENLQSCIDSLNPNFAGST
jgi:hypothetical protein